MATDRRLKLQRIGIGILITVFWLVMMFTLVRGRILPERRERALAAQSVEPSALTHGWEDVREYMVVRFGDTRIGSAATSIAQTMAGYRAEVLFGLNMDLLGLQRNVGIRTAADLDRSFDLRQFHIETALAGMELALTGLATDEELYVEVKQGKSISRSRYTLDRQISLLEAVQPLATRSFKLEPGNTLVVPVVDPIWSLERGMLEIRVMNRERITLSTGEVDAIRIETRLNEFVSTSWVDEQGNTLKRQVAGGLVLERASEGQARAAGGLEYQPIRIPPLNMADFKDVPVERLERLAEQKSSPLSILGTIMAR
jgi:hypothetical protein